MQKTGHANPELQIQAERYVATGYQRLLTFEGDGGGFSLFGGGPAKPFLSAYGLMLLNDMARVYPVDQDVVERTVNWLLSEQQTDGSWRLHDSRAGMGALGPTAYVTWALIDAGYEDTREVAQAIAYIREAALQEKDAYSLALAANALAAYDPEHPTTRALIDLLHDARVQDGDTVYWQMGDVSFMGATGRTGSIETTALATLALVDARAHSDAVTGALAYLVRGKDAWGTWNTTQATILSLKALVLASELETRAEGPANLSISLNNELTQEITIDETNADVVHLVTFDRGFSPSGFDEVQIELAGGGNLMYQVATHYYLPWAQVPPSLPQEELMTIDVDYDRTALQVNDEVTVDVSVRLNQEGMVRMALIDLGVPPGFTVLTEDLSKLVAEGLIARYELTGRQIIIYLEDFSFETPLYFSYRLRARFPMRAQTPPSMVYDYYNPGSLAMRAPLVVSVAE
jgi:uncharacterized protein YfaS (alpha-2-macroglobulin family)